MTSTTRMTSTKVTRERGIPLISVCSSRERSSLLVRVLVTNPPQQPDPVPQRAVESYRDPVRQRQDDGHHHGGLSDERQAGQPQFDAVPPVEEAAHPARVFDAKIAVLIQSVQRVIHTRVIAVAVSAGQTAKPPLFVWLADKVP